MSVTLPDNPSTQSATLGKDYLLKINTGTTASPTWTQVGAQRSADLKRSAESIDISHKTSGGWSSKKAGLRSWSIDLGGLMLLADDGIQALESAFLQGKEINIQLVYPDGSVQTGWGSITDFSLSTPHDGAAEISGTIEGNGALGDRSPSVSPGSAIVSKAAAADKVFTITPSTVTVSSVKDDGLTLTTTTNYTYSSGILTIKSAYLGAAAVGEHTIEVTTGDGSKLTARITVTA